MSQNPRLATAASDGPRKSESQGSTSFDAETTPETTCSPRNREEAFLESKNDVEVTATNLDCQTPRTEPRAWKGSFFRLGPLAGIACMLIAIASIFTALGVLAGSRNAVTTSWSIPPSTYLAICTAAANQALRFAAFQGLVIAWWARASRGDTLASLHETWRAGMTVGGAIAAGPNLGLVGLACLCSTLVAIDGPLLQKATTIELAPIMAPPVPLNITIAQEIPTDFTGGWDMSGKNGLWSMNFNQTLPTVNGNTSGTIYATRFMNQSNGEEWFTIDTIPGVVHGCPNGRTCNATIRAPALAVTSCSNHIVPVDYWRPVETLENILQFTGVACPLSSNAFLIDMSLMLGEREQINFITGYGRSDNCSGTFNYTICTLDSAVGDYDVHVTNGIVSLQPGLPRIVAIANNTRVNHSWDNVRQGHPSTLAGIVSLATQKYQSSAQFYYSHGRVWGTGYIPTVFRHYTELDTSSEQCFSYRNPQADVLHDLNRLMFMLGAGVASGKLVRWGYDPQSHMDNDLPMHAITEGYLQGQSNVFQTNLHWFAAAAAVELACILMILPTYLGWWKLGRAVSFSPLETAKAFEAPLLDDCNSNSSGRDISKALGHVRVRYGEIRNGASVAQSENVSTLGRRSPIVQTKLAFAGLSTARIPRNNTLFDV